MITVLVGMISSGKSTYCKNMETKNVIFVNDDRIVELVHGGDYTQYDKNLKPLYKSIENHIISVGVLLGKDIVIDRGLSISREGRQRFLALAKSFDVECHAIVFENKGPEFHATRRFSSDNRGLSFEYWLRVARHHNQIFEVPTLQEGFSKVVNNYIGMCPSCGTGIDSILDEIKEPIIEPDKYLCSNCGDYLDKKDLK